MSLTFLFEYPKWYDLWSKSVAGRILDCPTRLMRPEDAFLVLCEHVLRKGTLSLRDFMDFVHIRNKLDTHGWRHLRQISQVPIWRYIIALPLLLFCTIGDIFLSKQFVSRELIDFFTAKTRIRTEHSNELVRFLIRKYGIPIDLRFVMRYFGYKGTPLFGACLLWNQGRKLSPFEKRQVS